MTIMNPIITRPLNIAVLFDGAGLARLGLEQAGHICTGFELDPHKHALSVHVGSGNSILADVRDVDLSGFDAVWASPPCQWHSAARTQGKPRSRYAHDLLDWALALPHPVLWVENVAPQDQYVDWGTLYNAAQFLAEPNQCRNRVVGGRHLVPKLHREYRRAYNELGLCPAITATEYKGCGSDTRRASRYYGRRLTIEECAYHQGFTIPPEWYHIPEDYEPPIDPRTGRSHSKKTGWLYNIYEALGNAVPVYMARAFGEAYVAQAVAR